MTEVLLRALHVAVAAAWLGHKLLIPGDISRAVTEGMDSTRALEPRLVRAERFGIISGLGTLITGGFLVWYLGVDTIEAGVWVGAGLVMAAFVIGLVAGRPASRAFHAAVDAEDRPEAARAGRAISRVLATESLLWCGALVTMLI